jgi:hypothetical protein
VTELMSLRRENAELRAQLAVLAAQLAEQGERLNAVLEQLKSANEQLAKSNERIAELLAVAQRKQRKPAGEPLPPVPPPVLPDDAKRAFDGRPQPPPSPPKKEKTKKPPKPTGRKALPQHLEAETTHLRAHACGACGCTALDVVDQIVEEKLHVVKEHQRRRVVVRTTSRCRHCGERTTPRSLPGPYERSKVTCEWLAWFVHQKFALLAPLDRIRRDLAERDIPLAMSTLVSFIERAADLLAPIDGLHWKQLLASTWMATDGTNLKVLVPGLPKAHNGYIEQYRNDDVTVFQYEASKDGDIVESKVSTFVGTITSDAEHRFNGVFKSGQVIEAGCNAHGRRKFRDAEATQPVLAVEGGAFIGAMYGEEEKARALGLKGDALRDYRREHIRPIADEFDKWLAAVEPTLLPREPLRAAVGYYLRHRDALYRFIDDGKVPIDNSRTEREFQNVAKLRLNMLFAGSSEGAHRVCVILGIVATCRAIGVPVLAYLAWVFERRGTHREVFDLPLTETTPAAFKRAMAM